MQGLQWYPRYTGDYARKTKHLSLTEHGAYTVLLDYYYSTAKPLPILSNASSNAQLMPDHSRLYRLCGALNDEERQAVDNVLSMFFILTDDGYINERALETIEKQRAAHEKRVEAGRKGGKQRSSNASSNASSNGEAKPKQPEPEPEPDIIKEKNKRKVTLKDLSIEHIEDWLNEKRSKGIFTDIDEHLLLEKFKDYCTSKGKTYKCYLAGFRNAFQWNDAPKLRGTNNGINQSSYRAGNKSDRAKQAIQRGLDSLPSPAADERRPEGQG